MASIRQRLRQKQSLDENKILKMKKAGLKC